MDNITHSLVGVMLARVGLNRLSPRATLLLLLAANVPDADIITLAGGTTTYMEHHRGWSHAILLLPLIAMLPVLLVRLLEKQPVSMVRAWIASMVGVASHLALDYITAYGTRLLLPFSGEWLGLDAVNIIDLYIWIVLAIAFSAPLLANLVNSEIGAARRGGRGWAAFALAFVVLYSGGRAILRERAIAVQQSYLYSGMSPKRVLVMPTFANPFRWTGYVETGPYWSVHPVDLNGEFDPSAGKTLFKGPSSPLIEVARGTKPIAVLQNFSKAPLWTFSPSADLANHTEVRLTDVRFNFSASATVDPAGQVTKSGFGF